MKAAFLILFSSCRPSEILESLGGRLYSEAVSVIAAEDPISLKKETDFIFDFARSVINYYMPIGKEGFLLMILAPITGFNALILIRQ